MVVNLVLNQSTEASVGIIWASINIIFDIKWEREGHYGALIWSWLNFF